MSHQIQLLTPENGNFLNNLKKISFYVQNRSSRPRVDPCPPMSISAISKQRKIFHFVNFWDVSMRKEQQQPLGLINFAKVWSEHILKINTESHKVWASQNKRFLIGSCEFGHPGLIGLKGWVNLAMIPLCQKCPNRVGTTRG